MHKVIHHSHEMKTRVDSLTCIISVSSTFSFSMDSHHLNGVPGCRRNAMQGTGNNCHWDMLYLRGVCCPRGKCDIYLLACKQGLELAKSIGSVLGSKAHLLEREVIKHSVLFDIKSPILSAERPKECETATQMERLDVSS